MARMKNQRGRDTPQPSNQNPTKNDKLRPRFEAELTRPNLMELRTPTSGVFLPSTPASKIGRTKPALSEVEGASAAPRAASSPQPCSESACSESGALGDAAAAAAKDMIESDGTCAKEDQGEGQGRRRARELVAGPGGRPAQA